MKQYSYEKAIFDSWRNCVRIGLRPDICTPVPLVGETQIESLRINYLSEISALFNSAEIIKNVMPERTAFLLTDGQGVLLKKNTG